MEKVGTKTMAVQQGAMSLASLTPFELSENPQEWSAMIKETIGASDQVFLVAIISTIDGDFLILPKDKKISVEVNDMALGTSLAIKSSTSHPAQPVWLLATAQEDEVLAGLDLDPLSTNQLTIQARQVVNVDKQVSANIYWLKSQTE